MWGSGASDLTGTWQSEVALPSLLLTRCRDQSMRVTAQCAPGPGPWDSLPVLSATEETGLECTFLITMPTGWSGLCTPNCHAPTAQTAQGSGPAVRAPLPEQDCGISSATPA